MRIYRYLLVLILIVTFGAGFQNKCDGSKKDKKDQPDRPQASQTAEAVPSIPAASPLPEKSGDVKTLAEGSNGKMDSPFVLVARTAETYGDLQKMVEGLPSASALDFKKTAVIAAFAGEKPTGGYSVEITGSAGKYAAGVKSPPPDAMVTEALTMPFRVVAVPVEEEDSLDIDLSENWTGAMRSYRVTSGEIVYSGGLGGGTTRFEPKGTIRVLVSGEHISMFFDLDGKAGNVARTLNEAASGRLKDGKIELPRVEAAGFIEGPHPPLVVSGTFSEEKIALTFDPGKRDYVVNDGYSGGGKLSAEKVD
ncbi:MAG: protease complex subunit PrcB family protein [Pyrinomonadaceae bacterium]